MNEELLKEFMVVFDSIAGTKTDEERTQKLQKIGQEGLKTLFTQFQAIKNSTNPAEQHQGLQKMKQTYAELEAGTIAKLGAKLNYIKQLRGECPEGYQKLAQGGKCQKCENEKPIVRFKKDRCGGTVKKAKRMKEGGGDILGLGKKVNKYSEPNPKDPQDVLYDDKGNSVIKERGYFIKRKELPNGSLKDDTIKANNPKYKLVSSQFTQRFRNTK